MHPGATLENTHKGTLLAQEATIGGELMFAYAGGILSAAVDGIKVPEAVALSISGSKK
jgi:hypothetical protein